MIAGLDSSNGTGFIQQRLALFARVFAIVTGAFLLLGGIATAVLTRMTPEQFIGRTTIAHVSGLALITSVWLICRSPVQRSAALLDWLDAIALLGCSTAWALFIDPSFPESVNGAVISVCMTMLVRAIIVPSPASRTLRLSLIASLPVTVGLVLWVRFVLGGAGPVDAQGAWFTVSNMALLLFSTVALATIASRIIYDLRRRVREANELGQYALEERLGAGGMGEVWRARHRYLVRPAAIKLVRPELLTSGSQGSDTLMRRFEREALATAALRSPHTVQLYDFGQADDGTLFYVMELLVGIDLEDLVRRFGPVPPERAIHILTQVCHSLDDAHRNGLLHRDIKPANIFVSGAGTELDFVKVLDFGLVRLQPAGNGPERQNVTGEGMFAGTPAYAAPELALGDSGYDARVDLYAVGCVAYWLLTGQLVFESPTAMAMLVDHARTIPARPSSRSEQPIPPELEQIIMDCLEKDPARRPASAGELARRLSEVRLAETWSATRAARWWDANQPQPAQSRPVADVLLSREATPAKAVRRRATAI